MREIFRLVVKLLTFGGKKMAEMIWVMAKLYIGRLLWKWGLRIGLIVLGGLFVAIAYYFFKF